MKLNDVVLEAASPAQQAAIAISMKKAGKKPKQGVAEGSKESYMIIRTDAEGKKDVFAGCVLDARATTVRVVMC